MAKNLIINLVSIVPIKNEGVLMNEFFDNLKAQFQNIQNPDVISFLVTMCLEDGGTQISIDKIENGNTDPVTIPGISSDLGNPATLTAIFKFLRQSITGDILNTILVCWGHGMGYSMFAEIRNGDKDIYLTTTETVGFRSKDFEHRDTYFFSSRVFGLDLMKHQIDPGKYLLGLEDSHLERKMELSALTINELGEAINNSGIRFNMIILDNCFMQTVDTLFTLKNYTDYIIAAQSGVPWRGFTYSFFDKIKATIDDGFCGDFCENSYTELKKFITNKDVRLPNGFSIDDLIFSCIKTKNADAFLNALILMVGYINRNYYPSLIIPMYRPLTKCDDLSKSTLTLSEEGLALIDLKHYFDNVKIADRDYMLYYQALDTASKNNFVISKKTSPKHEASTFGISICFPSSWSKCKENPYYFFYLSPVAQVKSGFSTKTNWGEFLHAYLTDINVP